MKTTAQKTIIKSAGLGCGKTDNQYILTIKITKLWQKDSTMMSSSST